MSSAVIEARGVSKTFAIPGVRRTTVREHFFGLFEPVPVEYLRVLDDVNFDVRRGETLGIMGRNGSGKSTLLKVLCRIYAADAGTVDVRARITPILELGVGWNPELDAVDNVYLIGTVMGMSLSEVKNSLDEILAFAEVERFANLRLKHYSSGMASRLGYAVAFQAVQEVLILDEIFAVGDAGFRAKCEARYLELQSKGHTVVVVSHDPKIVERFCNRAILIERGRILAEGAGEEVAARYLQLTTSPPA